MRKIYIFFAILPALLTCSLAPAQTQNGFVRTIARPNQPAQHLQGVVVRLQGDYNPVMSDEQGTFQIVMPGKKNGTPYSLAGVNKGGYELREPELVGRQLPFSSSVPLEIIMVSRRQIQADKQRIEQAARENIERYYEQQLNTLNEQLSQAKLTNRQYEQQLSHLEQQYNNFEPLITQMAERYARTDYAALSEADSLIQQAIEQGDLQLAQQRILAKGDPEQREQKMQRIRRLAEAQRDELATDYYHLYSIHLSRFENDSALYYLLRRANLDTTNAQWALDAGNFYDKMECRFDEALLLYRRALRYAVANEGSQSLRAAQAHNNIAYALTRLKQYDEAAYEQRIAINIYTTIYGTTHEITAARLSNLGVIYYYKHNLDSAQYYFAQAESIYSSITTSIEEDRQKDISKLHAQLLNNQASIERANKQFDQALEHLQKALSLIEDDNDYDRVRYLRSCGIIYNLLDRQNDAHACWQQAYDIALRIYGADHPTTQELTKLLR